MKKIILTVGTLLLLSSSFGISTNASTLLTETTFTPKSKVTAAIEQKFYEIEISRTNYLDFPNTIWYSSGGYSGYLYFRSYMKHKNGLWYGTYNGYLLKGPFESNSIKPEVK